MKIISSCGKLCDLHKLYSCVKTECLLLGSMNIIGSKAFAGLWVSFSVIKSGHSVLTLF